jgi:fibronectin-binding autotransporter adhesin
MNIHGIQSVGTLTQQAGGFATLTGSFTGSFKGDGSQLTGITATFDSSSLVTTASFNAYTQSTNVRLNNIEATTASLNTSASLALVTASFDNGTRNLTFTKGDTTTFSVNIPDSSGSIGVFVTTSSFNAYTSSNDQRVSSLEAATSSLQGQLATIGTQSGSWITESETSSFARTGSNTFTGNQIIANGSTLSVEGLITANSGLSIVGAGAGINLAKNAQNSGSAYVNVTAVVDNVTDPTNVYSSYQLVDQSGNTIIAIAANSYTPEYPNTTIPYLFGGGNNTNGSNTGIAFPSNGEMDVWKKSNLKFGLEVTGSTNIQNLTASLANGYMWVGNSANKTTLVATSSFVVNLAPLNQATASLQEATSSLQITTASLNTFTASAQTSINALNVASSSLEQATSSLQVATASLQTFTASAQTSINALNTLTSSLATTGSNTFIGTESISGSLRITGSAYGNVVSMSITSNTASMDLSAGNYFELTSSVTPVRINFTNIQPGVTSTLIISASASSSIILGTGAAQPSGSAYSGSAGSIDILSLVAFNTSKVNVVATKALI